MIGRATVLGAAVLAVAAVLGADRIGVETAPGPAALTAEVTPAEQPVACPGPVEIPVGDIDTGDPELDSSSTDRSYDAVAEDPVAADAGFLAWADAAASIERVGGGDVAGLSAASCATPAREQWLVGGSTALGSSARLVLTNPTEATTEVTVTYYGPIGEVDERTVVTVAPGAQRDVLVEGVATEISALALRIEATGAGVVAHLQDSRLEGFQPGGTDWVQAGADPAERLVVPGVGADGDAETTLRLLAPDGATVELTLDRDQGIVDWGGVSALELEPGVVTEVSVPAVESGAVEVIADAPVVAAAMTRVSRAVVDGPTGALAYDLAWTAAQDATVGAPRSVVVTEHVTGVTVQASSTGTFTLTDASGDTVVTRTLGARSSVTLPLDLEAGEVLTASGRFAWSLIATDEPGFLSRLTPRRIGLEPLTVVVAQGGYVGR